MSRPNYGPGELAEFNNFPDKINVTIDSGIVENSNLFPTIGQSVILHSTPLSGIQQGDKIVGEELPSKKIIYSDTGSDTDFNLKISYYGWGKFYLQSTDDEYFSLDVTQGIAVQTGDWDEEKLFQRRKIGGTKIGATESMIEEFNIPINVNIEWHPKKQDDDGGMDDDIETIDYEGTDFTENTGGGCTPSQTKSTTTDPQTGKTTTTLIITHSDCTTETKVINVEG